MAISHPAASPAPPCPPSPGVGGVPLSSAIGDLLRFVLSSHAAGTGNPDHDPAAFPLSPSYCARLLDDDGDLCGKLAAGIEQCLDEGRLPGPPAAAGIPIGEEGPEETEWEAVLLEKGAELKLMYNAVDFELHVQEPYFTQLRAEAKTVEGRLATGNYNRITQGSLLLFNKCLLLNVEAVKKYSSFSEMLQAEIISNVLPGISSIEEGVKVYRKFYTEEREKSYGVLAISVSKPSVQPYTTMTDILAGLGYDGLGRLLGMARTAGTVPDGLPPPRSVLISSSMRLHQPNVSSTLPYQNKKCKFNSTLSKKCKFNSYYSANFISMLSHPNIMFLYITKFSALKISLSPKTGCLILLEVRGCSLTDAARALAKHVHRCTKGWWSDASGSDSSKNGLASEAIDSLLRDCCWMNVHLTQPYGPVFEIRVHEGYGARWSQDGAKFIGFLEPYTPEGFSKA